MIDTKKGFLGPEHVDLLNGVFQTSQEVGSVTCYRWILIDSWLHASKLMVYLPEKSVTRVGRHVPSADIPSDIICLPWL